MIRLHHVALAAALSLPAAAQTFSLDKTSPGTLGGLSSFRFGSAPPNAAAILALSTNPGPLPLSIFNPGDPRQLCVGVELAQLWLVQPTGLGFGNFALPTPNAASLHGVSLFCHGATLPGNPFLIGSISNKVTAQLGLSGRTAPAPFQLPRPRAYMPTFDIGNGKFLLVGGRDSPTGTNGVNTTDIYDSRTMQLSAGPNMAIGRAFGTITQLQNGNILFAGGVDANSNVQSTCEMYDVQSNTWRFVSGMRSRRAIHSARLLNNGHVLVVGGTNTVSTPTGSLGGGLTSCEVYNPTTNSWSFTGNLPQLRFLPGLITLASGRVLHSGGYAVNFFLGLPIPVGSVTNCVVYNPGSGNWTTVRAMNRDRAGHGFNMVRLNDNRILVSGGLTAGIDPTQGTTTPFIEVYNETNNTWTNGPNMSTSRGLHTMTLMPNGRVISTGGAGGQLVALVPQNVVQEFNPSNFTWRNLAPLNTARVGHSPVLSPAGLLSLFGGADIPGNVLTRIDTLRQ